MPFSQPTGSFKVPGPYDSELAAIARREKMAQIMQQQALQPLEINSFQGFQAPISPLQPLAKALQLYAAMNASEKGDEARMELGKKIRTEGEQQIASLYGTPAQPAIAPTPGTSFAPMSADYEDNPNLQVAPSGNVEMPGTPGRPAIPAMPLSDEERKQRLVQILSGGNPYAAPVAKLMWEDAQKAPSLVKEYEYARDKQGFKGTLQDFRQSMRPVSNTVVNMPHGAPFTVLHEGKLRLAQAGPNGTYKILEGVLPKPENELDIQKLIAARDSLPEGDPNRAIFESLINKQTIITTGPNSINTLPGQTPPAFVPNIDKGGTLNPENVDKQGNLIVTPTPGAAKTAADYAGAVAGAEASNKLLGTTQAQAEIDLPKVVDNAVTAQRHVQELLSHPGFKSSVGMGIPGAKRIPGTPQADFAKRLEQIQGGAFLTAIDTLKGTGAITEVEGAKATAAKNRMSTATSEKEFNDAAKDYLDIINQGVKQTYLKAGKPYVEPTVNQAPKTIDYGSLKKK